MTRNIERIRSLAKSVAALALAGGLSAPAAQAAEYARTDNGAAVAASDLLDALAETGVVASLASGETLGVVDAVATAGADGAFAYVGMSSEYLFVAALDGALTLEDDGGPVGTVSVGEAAVMAIASGQSRVAPFDVDRFLASTTYALPAPVLAGLESVAATQRERIYWGALRRTRFNAQAPLAPRLEAVRRDRLMHPTVAALRHEAGGEAETLARLTAERFLAGLQAGDLEAVRSLLSPALFSPQERAPSAWIRARDRYARALLQSPLRRRLAGAEIDGGDLENGFVLKAAGGASYRIRLSVEEAMTFVSEVKQEN